MSNLVIDNIESLTGNSVNIDTLANTNPPPIPAWPEVVEYGDLSGLQYYEFAHELEPGYDYTIQYGDVSHSGTADFVGIQFKSSGPLIQWRTGTSDYSTIADNVKSGGTRAVRVNNLKLMCFYFHESNVSPFTDYAGGTTVDSANWRLWGEARISNHARDDIVTSCYNYNQLFRYTGIVDYVTYHGWGHSTVTALEAHNYVRFAVSYLDGVLNTFTQGYAILRRQKTLTA